MSNFQVGERCDAHFSDFSASNLDKVLTSASDELKVSHMANRSASLDAVFHALSDPTRRAVIGRLCRGDATVSELAAPFDMALPSFVKHVAQLESSRLIKSRKTGRVRTCSLDHKNFAVAERWFDELRAQWSSRYDKLDTLLAKFNGEPK